MGQAGDGGDKNVVVVVGWWRSAKLFSSVSHVRSSGLSLGASGPRQRKRVTHHQLGLGGWAGLKKTHSARCAALHSGSYSHIVTCLSLANPCSKTRSTYHQGKTGKDQDNDDKDPLSLSDGIVVVDDEKMDDVEECVLCFLLLLPVTGHLPRICWSGSLSSL